jgi:hypothetical protein
MVEGTKDNPFKVEGGAVQVDGMALEFNIDPAADEDSFLNNINNVVAQMAAMVPEYDIEAVPVVEFGQEYIKAQPFEAQDLGCEPDYDAYTGRENTPPDVDAPFRTGSGHIHIGWIEGADIHDEDHLMNCRKVACQLDVYLALASLFFDKYDQRRVLYGKAGAFRPKTYGVEYRVLSNMWTKSPQLIRWVYSTTKAALKQLDEGNFVGNPQVAEIINNSDREAARELMNKHGISLPEGMEKDYEE